MGLFMTVFSRILTEREDYILSQRGRNLGIGSNIKTLEKLGEELSICAERVRCIECKALRKIQRVIRVYEGVPEREAKIVNLKNELKKYEIFLKTNEEGLVTVKNKEDVLIEDCELSTRLANCLEYWNFNTIGDVLKYTEHDLLRIPNFGGKCFREWKEFLEDIGVPHPYGETP